MRQPLLQNGNVLSWGEAGTPYVWNPSTSFNNPDFGVLPAELWNPATGTWTTLASSAIKRAYHATAILLRDGRVLLAGSGDATLANGTEAPAQRNAEIFSPPYLFKGTRPWIIRGPGTLSYSEKFFVKTTVPNTITQVTWLGLGSTTHAFDMGQRFMRLSFTVSVPSAAIIIRLI